MAELDFLMNTTNGIPDEYLYNDNDNGMGLTQWEQERHERECIHRHRARAYEQGYNYGYTLDDQYKIKNHALEAPQANGIYDAYYKGYKAGIDRRNREWSRDEILSITNQYS